MTCQGAHQSGQGGQLSCVNLPVTLARKQALKQELLPPACERWTTSRVGRKVKPDPRNDGVTTDIIQLIAKQRANRQLAVSALMDASELLGRER